jgi:signal peptide peptidase SppA
MTVTAHSPVALFHLEIEGSVWAIREELVPVLARFDGEHFSFFDDPPEEEPEAAGSVGIVPLKGILMSGGLFGFLFGDPIARFRNGLKQMVEDTAIKQIVLDIDSPGGQVDGIPELAAEVAAARKKKPIIASVNTLAASAAYWIASQASEIAITPSGEAGSIGVYTIHRDVSVASEMAGIKYTVVSAGKYKTETNPYQPLSSTAENHLQEGVDDFYDKFVKDVAKGRGATPEAIKAGYGQGRALTDKRALKAGLVDRIATFDEVVSEAQDGRKPARRKGEDDVDIEADDAEPEVEVAALSQEYTEEEKVRLVSMAYLFDYNPEEAANAG